ncbi:MFS transporter [Hoyosella rhizosphaerae]|uniref:MFS transporter n=1 Tax=Hoyosella rhizosphaerae TaxID=1755582 RepID=UPI00197FC2B7|nr:MFS transporter [Hoyosella rhizosphaerae]MBN4927127.1 MFS transporter [Hoyosella rhizosphaerae]
MGSAAREHKPDRTPGLVPLLILTALAFAGHALLFPVAPLWVVQHGSDTAGAGAVNAVLMLSTVLTQLGVPYALRRFGWSTTLIIGMVFLGVPSVLHIFTSNLETVLVLAALRGVGFGVLTVAGAAAVAELSDPAHRGKALGAYGLAIAVPQFVLIPLAPWVALNVNFWIVFIAGACPLVALLVVFPLCRHVGRGEPHSVAVHGEKAPLIKRRLVAPMLILLGVTAAAGALLTFIPQMTDSGVAALVALLVLTAAAAWSRMWFGALADRYGTAPFKAPLIGVTVVGLLMVAAAVATSGTQQWALLLGGVALIGTSYGGLQNLTLLDSFVAAGPSRNSTASATWNIGFDAGTGVGALSVGMIAVQGGFSIAFVVIAVLSLLTLPLARQAR